MSQDGDTVIAITNDSIPISVYPVHGAPVAKSNRFSRRLHYVDPSSNKLRCDITMMAIEDEALTMLRNFDPNGLDSLASL